MLPKGELKERLLATNCFNNNEWLNKYLDLIINCGIEKHIVGKSQNHHIIPKHVYIYTNLPIDNSVDNMVELLYKNHILAHIYLSLATNNKYIRSANNNAYRYMLNTKDRCYYADEIDIDWIDNFIDTYPELTIRYWTDESLAKLHKPKSEECKYKLSLLRWCNDGSKEYHYNINDSLPAGTVPGRLNSTIQKLMDVNLGSVWINNGEIQYHKPLINSLEIIEQDSSFTFGMLYRGDDWYNNVCYSLQHKSEEWCNNISKGKKQFFKDNPNFRNDGMFKPGEKSYNAGRISITNGQNNKYISQEDVIPKGWWKGNTQHHKKKVSNDKRS